jgi:hypothetical protein
MLEWVYSSKKITAQKNLGKYLSSEWVLQGKNYRSQKIKGKYFLFQGGDLAPLSVVK